MATNRILVLTTGETYHVFNRGVERRPLFTSKREHERFVELLKYYRFSPVPMRYSDFRVLPDPAREKIRRALADRGDVDGEILAYCLMPNHFHLVLRQRQERGIQRFLSNISNSYAKYFNTKHRRVGPLFQGAFKAVRIETDEQLLHITRYVHLNPVTAFMIQESEMDTYPWSSLSEYVGKPPSGFCSTEWVKEFFKKPSGYRSFVHDQVTFAKTLANIKHLAFDGEET